MISTLALALACFPLGFGLGILYFRNLRENARLWVEGEGRLRPALLHVARLLLAALVFALIARAGAAPLLASFFGFVLSRPAYVAFTRRSK